MSSYLIILCLFLTLSRGEIYTYVQPRFIGFRSGGVSYHWNNRLESDQKFTINPKNILDNLVERDLFQKQTFIIENGIMGYISMKVSDIRNCNRNCNRYDIPLYEYLENNISESFSCANYPYIIYGDQTYNHEWLDNADIDNRLDTQLFWTDNGYRVINRDTKFANMTIKNIECHMILLNNYTLVNNSDGSITHTGYLDYNLGFENGSHNLVSCLNNSVKCLSIKVNMTIRNLVLNYIPSYDETRNIITNTFKYSDGRFDYEKYIISLRYLDYLGFMTNGSSYIIEQGGFYLYEGLSYIMDVKLMKFDIDSPHGFFVKMDNDAVFTRPTFRENHVLKTSNLENFSSENMTIENISIPNEITNTPMFSSDNISVVPHNTKINNMGNLLYILIGIIIGIIIGVVSTLGIINRRKKSRVEII